MYRLQSQLLEAMLALIFLSSILCGALAQDLLLDIDQIKRYWGDATPYEGTPATYFGISNNGLPYGCGYECVSSTERA